MVDQLEACEIRIHCFTRTPAKVPQFQHCSCSFLLVELREVHGEDGDKEFQSTVRYRAASVARVENAPIDLVFQRQFTDEILCLPPNASSTAGPF